MRQYIKDLKARLDPAQNPYIRSLRSGEISREDFVETQIQFLFAVVFFSRPMMVLAGRMPRNEHRLALLENVHEEHGEGNLSMSHEQTFLMLMQRLGVGLDDIEARGLWPQVRAFNTSLAGLCTLDDVHTGLAALGIIEDLFSGISADIGQSIVSRGWLGRDDIVHYGVHEVLDVEHAESFYAPLERDWERHPRQRYQIQQGLELGGHLFMTMYEGLYRDRARRWMRDVKGPHSLADGWYLDTEAR